jgi:uncharacterized protein (UPF0261 family)
MDGAADFSGAMTKTIAILACLDTKGTEVGFVRDMILRLGHRPLLIDVGTKCPPLIEPDMTREEVARAAGLSWVDVEGRGKKEGLDAMIKGAPRLVAELHGQGRLDAILSLGGAMNTTIGTTAMQALPVGVPKVMVSTVVSGQRTFDPYVGTKDMILIHAVADLSGINRITRRVLENAVAALVGMVEHGATPLGREEGKVVAATMLGVTNDGVAEAARLVQQAGHEVVTFHANGVGGRAMEEMVEQGMVAGVMDLSLREIACEFYGGFCGGARQRLVAAGRAGIPQVVAAGAADTVDYLTEGLAPEWFTRKHIYMHPTIAHFKLRRDEVIHVVGTIADRLNQSRGPVTVLIPLRGVHQFSFPGGPLWDPPVEQALIDTFRERLDPKIRRIEVNANVNDSEFGKAAAVAMVELLSGEMRSTKAEGADHGSRRRKP